LPHVRSATRLRGMESSSSSPPTLTLQTLNRRSVLMLFAAMAVALAAGLLAWGPVMLAPDAQRYAHTRGLVSVANFMSMLAGLAMLLASLWAWRAVRRSRWTPSVQRPWSCFFACASLSGAIGTVHALPVGNASPAFMHALAVGGFSLMLLGFLAERVDARFGSWQACLGAIFAASVATGAWWIDASAQGEGDVRALLLLEILPLLLLPAGALDLRGRHTRAADWMLVLCIYAVARICGLADGAILEWAGWIRGHAVSQIATAAMASWVAWRCTRAASRTPHGFGSFGDSSQRKASLYTSF
jgi:hypothetical protein